MIAKLFFENALKYPNKIAIYCEDESITYSELAETVLEYSLYFVDKGISYKEHIAIPMLNTIESVAIMLVASNLGLTLVPINPTLPYEAMIQMIKSGNVKHFIAKENFYNQYDKNGGIKVEGVKILIEDLKKIRKEKLFEKNKMEIDKVEITGEETFLLTMTSGSTAEPKPIELTQKNKYDRAKAHIELYNITKDDIILTSTPLYHSLAERLVIIPLIIGATSVIMQRFTASLWLNCIKNFKVTFTIAVSAQLNQVAELLSSPFMPEIDTLRILVSSSSLLENHIKNKLLDKINCEFHEIYGTSETSTLTDINFKKSLEGKMSVGIPLKNVEVEILGNDGEIILKDGIIGEIVCRTPLLCRSYYEKEVEFSKCFVNGYFRTGDIGYIDKNGFLYFVGRKKEIIITGGINVYPRDIEICINKIEGVIEAIAFPYPDERLGEVVAIAIVLNDGIELKKRDIKMYCARNLADFQQPQKIFFIDEMPKNSMGKIVKNKLIEYLKKTVQEF